MTPEEFVDFNASHSVFDFLTVFPKEKLSGIKCSKDTLIFLTQTGIPTYAAPHFYFGDFEGRYLPALCDWPWRKRQYAKNLKAWVIGCDPDEFPVCILEYGQLFIFKTSQDRQLLNSSIPQAIEAFAAYAVMIDKAMAECGEDACISNNIPEYLISEFEQRLFSIEKSCCFNSSFWRDELRRLKKES